MVKLHLICGFLGAGKSTFSKKLAQDINGVHLNPDEWCMKRHSAEEYETDWDKCFNETIDFLWQKTHEYLASSTDVIFDMGFWSKESRDFARSKALDFGAECVLYYIYAPDEILKERIAARKGTIAENNINNFDKIKQHFEEPGNDESFILINNF